MSNQSLVLLINCKHPAPFRSVGVDGKIVETVFTSMPHDFHKYSLQNSCDNLFCFAKKEQIINDWPKSVCLLLDLDSKKVIMLPESTLAGDHTSKSVYGVGFDSRAEHHKILRIDVTVDGNFIGAQINTLGEDTWEPVRGLLPLATTFSKPVSVDGALVWSAYQTTSTRQLHAQVFNIAEEKFSSVRLPPQIQRTQLVALGDQLCAVDQTSDSCIQIWVLQELYAQAAVWDSLCVIKMSPPRWLRCHWSTNVVGKLENGRLLLKSGRAYYMYEAETERLRHVKTHPGTEVLCYRGRSS